MPSKQGGKQKPLTAPKRDKKELDDDDVALQQKLKAEAKAKADFVSGVKKGKK